MGDSFRYVASRPIPDDPIALVVCAQLAWHRCRESSELGVRMAQADQVEQKVKKLQDLETHELMHQLRVCQTKAASTKLHKNREDLLDALALLCIAAHRVLGIMPYKVQVVSTLAMYDGFVVQLAPGEGKTMTIGLLAVLHGWSGKPCHVITANDYLAERDADELEPLFNFCGVTVGKVLHRMTQEEKRDQYQAAIVYATVKQLLADYLTDQISFGGPVDRLSLSMHALKGGASTSLLMRGLHVCIVDEADNVLIDEAITPMIISASDEDAEMEMATKQACTLVERLKPNAHYQVETRHRDVKWTSDGQAMVESFCSELPPLWRGKTRREDLLAKAILARDYFKLDLHYMVKDDEVVIIDEGTGRPMPGRSWSFGLHQAVEARANVPLTKPRKTLARLSFQNYFKLYRVLSGASGTLQNIGYELFYNYRTGIMRVPSRLPSQLIVHPYTVVPNASSKWASVINLIQCLQAEGKPVLVGSRTIEQSENLSDLLHQRGITHRLLNAKKLDEEASVVSMAGQAGQVTLATNMAGRGTDIKLAPGVSDVGGLCVILLEPHESARIDWQLYGRAGRQGQPGHVYPFLSFEDELFTKYINGQLLRLCQWLQLALPKWPVAAVVTWLAQKQAELRAFNTRKYMNNTTREHQKRMTFTHHE